MRGIKHISRERLKSIRNITERSTPGYGYTCYDIIADLLDEIDLLEKEEGWLTDYLAERDCPHNCSFEEAPTLEECAVCWRMAAKDAIDAGYESTNADHEK